MWDEKREVALTGRRALMHVVVFDWDKVGTDDFLGEALVVLDQYLDGEQHTLELELDVLEGNAEDGDISGTIRIELASRQRRASLAAGGQAHRTRLAAFFGKGSLLRNV